MYFCLGQLFLFWDFGKQLLLFKVYQCEKQWNVENYFPAKKTFLSFRNAQSKHITRISGTFSEATDNVITSIVSINCWSFLDLQQ